MFAFVVTIWRHDGSYHRFVRVAPFAAAAIRSAIREVVSSGIAHPPQIAGVAAHWIERFDERAATEQWIQAMHGTASPVSSEIAPANHNLESIPTRTLH